MRDIAVDAVRRHGGVVNQAIGEEIVSVFGVPTAHEDDELRAVRAALELHARVRALAADAGGPNVRIQSGLHVGPLVAQRLNEGPRRYNIVGPPASRVEACRAGNADDLVLSPDCQRLVAPFVHTAACAPVMLEPDAGGRHAVSRDRRDRGGDAAGGLGAGRTHALRRPGVGPGAAREARRPRARGTAVLCGR